MNTDLILILDFGGNQAYYTARRLRGEQFYCEILPGDTDPAQLIARAPKGIVLTGGDSRELRADTLPFDPELFRLVLPSARCLFEGVEGDIEPPRAADLPGKTWLAYGSSITHGSLGLMMPYSYPFRIAQKLGCDHFNMGFAGAAHLEKEVAEYIVSRKDWDFASVEMGVNMVGGYTPEQFEERVDAFTSILAQDGRPVFATDIFGHNIPNVQEKAELFRAIVRKYAQKRLIFTEGLELLNNPAFISEDLVHPSLEGLAQIANRWSTIMRSHLEQNHLL